MAYKGWYAIKPNKPSNQPTDKWFQILLYNINNSI